FPGEDQLLAESLRHASELISRSDLDLAARVVASRAAESLQVPSLLIVGVACPVRGVEHVERRDEMTAAEREWLGDSQVHGFVPVPPSAMEARPQRAIRPPRSRTVDPIVFGAAALVHVGAD